MSNYPPGVTGSEPQIVGYPDSDDHQAEDGRVHLAYFDKESDTSFVWNGSKGGLVDVCEGGYGEPISDQFVLEWTELAERITLSAFAYFKAQCDAYLALKQKGARS